MAETIKTIADELGLSPANVLEWSKSLSLPAKSVTSTVAAADSVTLKSHLLSIIIHSRSWCCDGLVDAVHGIKERLPALVKPPLDPNEGNFLTLRASLGHRQIDPLSPASPEPVAPATARWCGGDLVGIAWASRGATGDSKVEVTQGVKKHTPILKAGVSQIKLPAFKVDLSVDLLQVFDAKGTLVAAGGPFGVRPAC